MKIQSGVADRVKRGLGGGRGRLKTASTGCIEKDGMSGVVLQRKS